MNAETEKKMKKSFLKQGHLLLSPIALQTP